MLSKIAFLSESRGKDSSGIAFCNYETKKFNIIRGDIPIRRLLKSNEYNNSLRQNLVSYKGGHTFTAFGHARLVTNGSQLQDENNQPVLKDNMCVIHNGIITNVDSLWKEYENIKREYLIDTEIIPTLIQNELDKEENLIYACNKTFRQLEGTYSLAMMHNKLNQFVIATNNGSLYYINNNNFIVFASEEFFLKVLKKKACFAPMDTEFNIHQLKPNYGMIIDLVSLSIKEFSAQTKSKQKIQKHDVFAFDLQCIENKTNKEEVIIDPSLFINRLKENNLYNVLEYNLDAIRGLKRCSKCLLPETFPHIVFDEQGVCNYCNHYKPKTTIKSLDELNKLVEPYRRNDGKPDCIVPFSGGRDSTYSLHIIKKELGLNPIAFTYDWGMVTDLARRNIARVCGKLGVENIIVSADIHWKRENIRKNIKAWLKNPSLGMVPLFMAGDKYFFYYCNEVKKQTGINLNIWGINYLENTEFKTGFAGISPNFEKTTIYALSQYNKLKLFKFVGANIIKSPGYINQSIFDSLGSFAARYSTTKKDYYHLFDYYNWNENEINYLLKNEYNWEKAIDTKSTWRIGDGTASFYNYIYYTVTGFSENDTFRSNQIREGMLTRNEAMSLIEEDNIPRYETIRWYLEILGLDFEQTIKIINNIPKLYNR
ncbi:MAG: hypothetical protein M0R23_02950 [Bacteroidales bacterium]|nr:hypothetical protein [Bacteroidales bacterium]